jgi:hypothetical protein
VNVQITHFSIKKKPRNILKWEPPGSHLEQQTGHWNYRSNETQTRARLNRSKSPEITQTKLGLPSIDPPLGLGALPVCLVASPNLVAQKP